MTAVASARRRTSPDSGLGSACGRGGAYGICRKMASASASSSSRGAEPTSA
jgi:hypothetical protein